MAAHTLLFRPETSVPRNDYCESWLVPCHDNIPEQPIDFIEITAIRVSFLIVYLNHPWRTFLSVRIFNTTSFTDFLRLADRHVYCNRRYQRRFCNWYWSGLPNNESTFHDWGYWLWSLLTILFTKHQKHLEIQHYFCEVLYHYNSKRQRITSLSAW